MTDVQNPAETSAAAEPVQYDSWDDKGTPIVSKKDTAASNAEPPNTQESATASTPESKATPEGEPKTAADSEAANKQQERRGKKPAEDRISELVAERNKERSERQALEERLRKLEAAAQPPSKTEQKTEAQKQRKRPQIFSWTGTPEEYEAELDAYEAEKDARIRAEVESKQLIAKQQADLNAMGERGRTKYEDFNAKVEPTIEKLVQHHKDMHPLVSQALERTGNLEEVLYAFGADEQLVDKFIEASKSDPIVALEVLHVVRDDIAKEIAKSTSAKSEVSEDKPPVESKPRAPKPPSEVGGRSAAGDDVQVSAARRGDFAAFEAEENRRLRASR